MESRTATAYRPLSMKNDMRTNACHSFLGGRPYLTVNTPWPHYRRGKPMRFLFQVDLESLPTIQDEFDLPSSGIIQVFHAPDESFGGYAPETESHESALTRVAVRIVGYEDDDNISAPSEDDLGGEGTTPLTRPEKCVYIEPVVGNMEMHPDNLEWWEEHGEDNDDAEEVDDLLHDYLPPTGSLVGDEWESTEIEATTGWNENNEPIYDPNPDEIPKIQPELYFGSFGYFRGRDFRLSSDFDGANLSFLAGSFSGPNVEWGDRGVASFWVPDDGSSGVDHAFMYWDD